MIHSLRPLINSDPLFSNCLWMIFKEPFKTVSSDSKKVNSAFQLVYAYANYFTRFNYFFFMREEQYS